MTPPPAPSKSAKPMTYAASGVDIDAGDQMVHMIKRAVASTYGPRVLDRHGAFAGLFRLDYNEKLFARNYREPLLVACTDGVGTKIKLAAQLNIYNTVGIDLVAMSVNDLLVTGAEPLLFLDYIATSKLDPAQATAMVEGVAEGCRQARCALLGGETAEMPDIYSPGEFDMAGFAVGVVERKKLIDPTAKGRVESGDVVLGLASSGIHSNGYSLVRAIVDQHKLDLNATHPMLKSDKTLGQTLLEPTRIYVRAVLSVLNHYRVKQPIVGMAHITGGGLVNNLNRALPGNLDAKLKRSAWPVPPIFKLLKKLGNIEQKEIDRVFNNGIGYTLIVRPAFAHSIAEQLKKNGQDVYTLGTIVKGSGKVKIA